MGGRMWVESEEGEGSTFHFTIRCTSAAVAPSSSQTAPLPETVAAGMQPADDAWQPGNHRARILLAEDNGVNQLLARRILEKHGFHVTVVANGKQAVASLEQTDFDLVLMDVQMPTMGGFEAAGLIRANEARRRRRVPIVAMTAHALKGDRERCIDAGMDDYVSKPIDAAVLIATVNRWLETASTAAVA
jgi:CheY-like chemotaxis protein